MGNYVKEYPEATFNWIDLSTGDVEDAKRFYTGLFGWDAEDQPLPGGGVYTMLRMNGRSVAGLGPMPPGQPGHHAYWSSYVKVSDVDDVTKRAAEAGATIIMPPMDVMEEGRMSVVNDPTGAYVGFWQPRNHIGAELVNIPNTLVWNELITPDVERAKSFYSDLLDWTVHADEVYTMFKSGGRAAGGIVPMPENMPEGSIPNWSIYFLVEDVKAAMEKAQSLGGTVLMGPIDLGENGIMATISDSQGGVFNVMWMSVVDPMP